MSRQVLDQFCSFSGHKVSTHKTQFFFFFFANVDGQTVVEVCSKLGFQRVLN